MILSAGLTWFQSRSEATGAVALATYALTIQEPP
jgi:predicted transcriptional regulator